MNVRIRLRVGMEYKKNHYDVINDKVMVSLLLSYWFLSYPVS